jgi:lipid A 3-O-deacylase
MKNHGIPAAGRRPGPCRNHARPAPGRECRDCCTVIRAQRWLCLAAFAAGLGSTPLTAQTLAPTTWAFRADNDFFNFWQAGVDRPDEEYTHGLEISATWSARPVVLRRLFPARSPCTTVPSVSQPCTRLRLAIGQEMYTPDIDSPQLLPGERPYAGWLYATLGESAESPRALDELSVTVGVTGPPSLAEAAQRTWHQWFHFRTPRGWGGQLPFEPDVAASWYHARELIAPRSAAARFVHVAPYGHATIGTLQTSIAVGGSMTIGINPRPAWQPTFRRLPVRTVGLYVGVDVQSALVLRNLFLDGDTFRSSSSVTRNPLVGQVSGTLGLSLGRVRAEWCIVHLSREYTTQSTPHTYSRLTLKVE